MEQNKSNQHIMKNFKFCLISLLATIVTVGFMACSTDDDEPKNTTNENVIPTKPVDDPAGTIIVNMFNDDNGGTILFDKLYIMSHNVFWFKESESDWSMAVLGSVKGLGDVVEIPSLLNWARVEEPVVAGYAYLVCESSKYLIRHFHSLFVEELLKDSYGHIIGAKVRYCKNFCGTSEPIRISRESFNFSSDEQTGHITVTNSSIVPYTVHVQENDWCSVSLSGYTSPIQNSDIDVHVEANDSGVSRETVVTVNAYNGSTVSFKVTQRAS